MRRAHWDAWAEPVLPARTTVQESTARINSIDFHRAHDLLVTGGDDDAIRLYNTETGTAQQALLSKKYGVKSVCFTHDPGSVIYSSNKVGKGGALGLGGFSCRPGRPA